MLTKCAFFNRAKPRNGRARLLIENVGLKNDANRFQRFECMRQQQKLCFRVYPRALIRGRYPGAANFQAAMARAMFTYRVLPMTRPLA